jgi:hypothetical protein
MNENKQTCLLACCSRVSVYIVPKCGTLVQIYDCFGKIMKKFRHFHGGTFKVVEIINFNDCAKMTQVDGKFTKQFININKEVM